MYLTPGRILVRCREEVISPAGNRSVYVIGFDWFLRAGPPDWHTKTSWCFIGPASWLKPPGKNQPAGPAPAGHSPWCHGFCQRDNKQNNITILHHTTSAKTRATVRQLADQRHIPPNVSCNFNS